MVYIIFAQDKNQLFSRNFHLLNSLINISKKWYSPLQ